MDQPSQSTSILAMVGWLKQRDMWSACLFTNFIEAGHFLEVL